MSWYEPSGLTPPSASIYCSSNSQQLSNGNNDSNSPYLSQLERMSKDPLSRRLMSLISPMLPSASLSPFLSKKSLSNALPLDADVNVNNSNTNVSTTSVDIGIGKYSEDGDDAKAIHVLSPFPHPSFLHREAPISPLPNSKITTFDQQSHFQNEYEIQNDSKNHFSCNDDSNSEYRYFFYPRIVENQPQFLQDHHNPSSKEESEHIISNTTSSSSNQHHHFNEYGNNNGSVNLHHHTHHNNFNEFSNHQQQPHHYDHTYDNYDHMMYSNHDQQQQQQSGLDYYPDLDERMKRKAKKQSHFIRNNTNDIDNYDNNNNNNINVLGITTSTTTHHDQDWDQIGQFGSYRQGGIQYDDVIENQDVRMKKRKKKKRKKRRREDYGGCDTTAATDDSEKKKKRKQKASNSVQILPDIRTMMSPSNNINSDDINDNGHKRNAEDDIHHNQSETNRPHHGDNDTDFETNREQTKKRSSTSTSAAVPAVKITKGQRSKKTRQFRKKTTTKTQNRDISSTETTKSIVSPIPCDTIREFVETYNVLNAGSNTESLREFLRIVKSKKYVSWTMIFQDLFCTTPNLPSSKKYCTEKGPECIMWNCTCDNQVRAVQASAPLLGAMFIFPVDDTIDINNDDDDICCSKGESGGGGNNNLQTFILPLAPTSDPDNGSTKDIDAGYERMANWPFLPIACDTSLQQRWEALRSILTDRYLTCVTFNAQATLMPYHYHCANDVKSFSSNDGTNSANNDDSYNFGYLDLILPNIWDLRLASWMLSPHAAEEDLELDKKMEGFRHLLPKNPTSSITSNIVSKQFLGLLDAKKQLEFLYIIYPVINNLLEENGLFSAFCEIESPVQSVLSSMEVQGMGFKPSRLLQIQSKIESQLGALSDEAQEIANDKSFSLSSPQQVSSLLYDKMGLEVPKLGPTSKSGSTQHRSTSEEMLKQIKKEATSHGGRSLRIIDILLEFRSLSKMLNTYIKPYPRLARKNNCIGRSTSPQKKRSKKLNTESMKMYPMWMQTAVRTGRLSCRKPNIQQIPTGKKTYEMKIIFN